MKLVQILVPFLVFPLLVQAQKLTVSDNQRFLVTEDGHPFFWLADTAWELFHRCDRKEADYYLQKRKSQGFNVIHAVALAEIDGLNTPNPYGHTPLIKYDPAQPNEKYFEHVDYVIQKADELDMYIALLPTWGDKLFKNNWGVGPEVFNVDNARTYGQWIGNRYKDYDNIVWIIGGDRNPRENTEDVAVWRSMAKGIVEAVGGEENVLMSFHPQPKEEGGSSTWFHQDKWLDFNMHQTGHCANQATYDHITHDYQLSPTKPVLDGEPLYEDHPNCFNAKALGHSAARDIRRIMYWNVFAGGFGQSYGCHAVWQMYTAERVPINQALRPWKEALDMPMANQVKHLKNLMLSRPFLTRIPDQSMVLGQAANYSKDYIIATRDSEGTYAMIYFPTGKSTTLNLSQLRGKIFNTWWYDTRTGATFAGKRLRKAQQVQVHPPSSGIGNDWVLVIDAKKEGFASPGKD
ncbi:MAG: glycoside hydrolase family 140 protein [Bacteroidota bacterium]